MGVLRKFDFFKAVNPEHVDGSLLGTFLTFVCVTFVVVFFSKEITEYRSQKLTTKLNVCEYPDFIPVSFDISFHHANCTQVFSTLQKSQPDYKIEKVDVDDGCRVNSSFNIDPTDNLISFTYGQPINPMMMMADPFRMDLARGSVKIDFSHTINKFELGSSGSYIRHLESKFPDMIKVNALEAVTFNSTSSNSGHSLFLYELNIVRANVRGSKELIYNYNKNTVNTDGFAPYVNFKLKFSPIGVEYVEGNENFWEFLTYMLGIVGGIISVVKFGVNMLSGLSIRKQPDSIIPS